MRDNQQGSAHSARKALSGGNFERGPSWGELRRIRAHTIKPAHPLAHHGGIRPERRCVRHHLDLPLLNDARR